MATHWRAGQRLTAGLLTIESSQVEDTTSRTTTSTSYTDASGGAFSTSVIVPASGAVVVELRSTQRNSGGATNTITSWSGVGSVSGTVYSPNDTAALIVAGTSNVPVDLSYRLSSLTPGETLTVTMKHRVNAGTGTFDYRLILVVGMP